MGSEDGEWAEEVDGVAGLSALLHRALVGLRVVQPRRDPNMARPEFRRHRLPLREVRLDGGVSLIEHANGPYVATVHRTHEQSSTRWP